MQSCFGRDDWPANLPVPQAWLEFDVADIAVATEKFIATGYHLLIANCEKPWGKR